MRAGRELLSLYSMSLRLMTIFRHIVALWLFGNKTYPDYDDKNDETGDFQERCHSLAAFQAA
jgi:hypothetical protein